MMFDYFSLQNMLIYNEFIPVQILINISVTDYAFIDSFFTCKFQFLTELIHTSLNLKAFNDQNAGQIIYIITLLMFIFKGFTQCTLFLVIKLLKQDIIFNYFWLQTYNAIIDCSQGALLINYKDLAGCYTVWNLNLNLNLNLNPNLNQNETQNQIQNLLLTADSIHLIGAAPFTYVAKQKDVQVFIIIM